MGPMAVVVSGEDVKDMLELLVVHDQEPVQADATLFYASV